MSKDWFMQSDKNGKVKLINVILEHDVGIVVTEDDGEYKLEVTGKDDGYVCAAILTKGDTLALSTLFMLINQAQ